MNWYALSIKEVFEMLGSGPDGLPTTETENRLSKIGPNKLDDSKKKGIAGILLSQFTDVMILKSLHR